MDSQEHVKRLFEAVLQKEGKARAEFLDGISGVDPKIRSEVESLLAAHREESPGTEEGATAIRLARPGTARPERIGPYRILREIGHGGMGIVYEAEQERPVHRKVALKLIKWGMDTREVVARFESERQALALMSHPNIAAVHDAGATDEGRPYFVMEYIAGVPITEYCDTHRLGVLERLALFVRVCEGAQHAHQKGVIHRDLKPSNVLVTIQDGEPVPKIIDFGVAKATTQRLTEKTVYTELGQLIGTPEYMSPEQAEMTGLDVDTRTDVYSLGVLLYELLVGAQPFDAAELRKAGFDEIRRKIREDDPPTPSTRLSTLGDSSGEIAERRHTDRISLRRALRGDLDWIVLKALAKDRTRRYASASELAQDIGRHLRNEPVLAGPPSTAYRLGKFIRRHRVGVTAATLVFLALLGGVIGTTIGFVRAREAERLARAEAEKAQAINLFLQETLGSANPITGSGRNTTVLEALDRAVGEIETSFADQPAIEAAVRSTIALTYIRLRRYEEAEPLLRRALQIRKRLYGDEHLETIKSLNALGMLYSDWGKRDEAERFTREAVELARQMGDQREEALAEPLLNLAGFESDKGNLEEAESMLREVLTMWRKADDEFALAWTQGNLANVLRRKGNYEEAEALYRESVDGFRKTRGNDHPMVGSSLYGLAASQARLDAPDAVQESEGDCAGALPLFEEAIEIESASLGEEAAPWMRTGYGRCLTRLERYPEAEEQLLKAYSGLKNRDSSESIERPLEGLIELYEAWGTPEKADEYRALMGEAEQVRHER